jgi:N-acetylglucosamine-6-phosphate deacetylase
MHDTFKNLVKINFSMEKAVAMTSFNAAQYLGEKNKGKIDRGFTGNLIVLDKELNIRKVYLNGNLIS